MSDKARPTNDEVADAGSTIGRRDMLASLAAVAVVPGATLAAATNVHGALEDTYQALCKGAHPLIPTEEAKDYYKKTLTPDFTTHFHDCWKTHGAKVLQMAHASGVLAKLIALGGDATAKSVTRSDVMFGSVLVKYSKACPNKPCNDDAKPATGAAPSRDPRGRFCANAFMEVKPEDALAALMS